MITLSVLGMFTVGSVFAYQRADRRRQLGPGNDNMRALPPPATERTLVTLVPGDVVLDGGEDWLVIKTARYREENERWLAHTLEDGPRQRRLQVKVGGDDDAMMLTPVDDLPLFGQLLDGLTYRGQGYRLHRRGDAQRQTVGRDADKDGLVKFVHYTGPNGATLVVEEDQNGRRAFAGLRVLTDVLTLMPGDGLAPTETSAEEMADALLADDDARLRPRRADGDRSRPGDSGRPRPTDRR